MDFNKILDEWEKAEKKKKQKGMNNYLDQYLPDTESVKEKKENQTNVTSGEKRAVRLKMKPQRSLDLHGMRVKEACKAVDHFLFECKKDGLIKVLIIHGKGRHSREPFVLAKRIKAHIQRHPFTGECGSADKKSGGIGALWVIIR